MSTRAPLFFCLACLLSASCGERLTVEVYVDLLAERLEAASRGEDPDAVLVGHGVELEEYERFELEVFSDRDLAAEVVEALRRGHPEVFPPDFDLPADAEE
jgi:hypothetical protein